MSHIMKFHCKIKYAVTVASESWRQVGIAAIFECFFSWDRIRSSRRCLAFCFGVATMSRLLQIICLFCKRALQKRLYHAKETYKFKEPTHHSHPITGMSHVTVCTTSWDARERQCVCVCVMCVCERRVGMRAMHLFLTTHHTPRRAVFPFLVMREKERDRECVCDVCVWQEQQIFSWHRITILQGLSYSYGVATISRLLKMIGLFDFERLYSAKETYHFKEPANRSHPIVGMRERENMCGVCVCVCDESNVSFLDIASQSAKSCPAVCRKACVAPHHSAHDYLEYTREWEIEKRRARKRDTVNRERERKINR